MNPKFLYDQERSVAADASAAVLVAVERGWFSRDGRSRLGSLGISRATSILGGCRLTSRARVGSPGPRWRHTQWAESPHSSMSASHSSCDKQSCYNGPYLSKYFEPYGIVMTAYRVRVVSLIFADSILLAVTITRPQASVDPKLWVALNTM